MDTPSSSPSPLGLFVLVRLLAKAKTPPPRSQIAKDLKPLFGFHQSAADWTDSLDETLQGLQTQDLMQAKPFRLTDAGRKAALSFLGVENPPNANWPTLRDRYLIALALGISPQDKAAFQAVGTSKGLKPAVLVKHFGLPGSPVPSESRVVHLLAWQQLRKPHDIEIPPTEDFKPKAVLRVTLLNGQKGDPVTLLAAQVTKAEGNPVQRVREAVIRQWLKDAPIIAAPNPTPSPSRDIDLNDFAGRVRNLAQTSPTGRFGENKVFLSHVWHRFQTEAGNGMTRADFDRRLVEANRQNLLTLSRADLVSAMNPEDVLASEIRLPNATFHFIRTDR